MKRLIASVLAIFVASVLSSSASARGPHGSIRVGNWSGGAYTSDTTGAFSHCAAGASYQNGFFLIVSQTANSSWTLGFQNSNYYAGKGRTFPLVVTFDGQATYRLFGIGISDGFFAATLPLAALNQFKKSRLMVLEWAGDSFQFSLSATGQLVSTVANCVSVVKAEGLGKARDFSVKSLSTPSGVGTATSETETKTPPANSKTVAVNGTGFAVDVAGHIVTNNHVIAGCIGEIQGSLPSQSAMKLRVVARDQTNDLALLEAPEKLKSFVNIRAAPIRSGDSVIAIGYPYHGLLTSDFTVTTGIVSSLSGLLNDTRHLQITAAVQPGNSGGPLLDMSGNLVGIVAAKINAIKFAKVTGDIPESINFAIKTGSLRDFLDNSAISYQVVESKVEMRPPDIAQAARAYTMLISCQSVAK